MSTFCNAAGSQTKFYTEPGAAPHTFDSSSERWSLVSDGVRKQQAILQSQGMRGERGAHISQVRKGQQTIGGTIEVEPSPLFFDAWLPRILGGAESSDSFPLAETLQSFGILADRDSQTYEYTDCKVNSATLSGSGGLLRMTIDIVAKTEVSGTPAPTVSLGTADGDAPYQFADLTVSMDSGSRSLTDFSLTINNNLETIYYHNLTPQCFVPGMREITLTANAHLDDTEEAALYDVSEDGIAAALTLTNGNMSTVFNLTRFSPEPSTPVATTQGAFFLPLSGAVRGSGSTAAIVVTNDSDNAS